MFWKYYLIIDFFFGISIGAIITYVGIVYFNNRKIIHQQQKQLKRNIADLENYHKELISSFARSYELLDNMAQDHYQLYQQILKDTNNLKFSMTIEDHLFNNHFAYSKKDSKSISTQVPRDYPDSMSDNII